MALPAMRSVADLFDNPVFSDVTVTVRSSSGSRQYTMHRAVLSQGSDWFYEQFTIAYEDARNIPVECDDGPLFEILLRSIYQGHYDTAALNKLATDNETQLIVLLARFYRLAKQYAAFDLSVAVLTAIYAELMKGSHELLGAAIQEAFQNNTKQDPVLRDVIPSVILKYQSSFVTSSEQYHQLLELYPAFAVAMAVTLSSGMFTIVCSACSSTFTILSCMASTGSEHPQYCPVCKDPLSGATAAERWQKNTLRPTTGRHRYIQSR